MSAHVEATFTGTIRNMDKMNTYNDKECINVYIPEEWGKDEKKNVSWHKITFWGKQAVFVANNFASGTVITVTCSITRKQNNSVTLYARSLTPLSNWGKSKQQAA